MLEFKIQTWIIKVVNIFSPGLYFKHKRSLTIHVIDLEYKTFNDIRLYKI